MTTEHVAIIINIFTITIQGQREREMNGIPMYRKIEEEGNIYTERVGREWKLKYGKRETERIFASSFTA